MINIEKSSTQRCSVKKYIHVYACDFYIEHTYFFFSLLIKKSKVLLELQKMVFVFNEQIVEVRYKKICVVINVIHFVLSVN